MAESENSTSFNDKSVKQKINSTTLTEALAIYTEKVSKEMKSVMLHHGYMEFFKDDPTLLKTLHHKILSQFKEHLQSELCKMCEDENMDAVLGSLDEIISEQNENLEQTTWRPSGNPRDDIRDHLYSVKLQHKGKLESILAELDETNANLLNIVKTNEEELVQRNSALTEIITDYGKAVDVFGTSSVCIEEMDFIPLRHNNCENSN